MNARIRSLIAITLVILSTGLPARASSLAALDLHGSVSATASYSDRFDYLGDTKENLSLNLIDVILNSTHRFDSGLRLGGQIYAYKLGDFNDLTLDFASADYSFNQQFGVRAGRNKLPHGLYNDSQDLDAIRTFASLPFSFYPRSLRTITASFDGLTFYGNFDLQRAGSLDYQIYGGAKAAISGADTPLLRGISNSLIKFDEWTFPDGVYGLSIFWNLPVEGLKIGYSYMSVPNTNIYGVLGTTDTLNSENLALAGMVDAVLGPGAWDYSGLFAGTPATVTGADVTISTASTEYTRGKWVFAAEYKLIDQLHGTTTIPALAVLGQPITIPYANQLEYYYGSVSYEATDRVGLGYYYAESTDARNAPAVEQDLPSNFSTDHCFALSYKLTPWCILKAEYHFMDGLTPLTMSGDPLPSPAELTAGSDWKYLVLKTTVSF